MVSLLLRQGGTALRVLLVATVVLGLLYPLAVWGVSRLPGLNGPAEGSVLAGDSGSALIGIDPVPADPATDPYFHTRPSASAEDVLGPGDPSTSGGSNQGGFSQKLLGQVEQRRAAIAAREGVAPEAVPADAVTASASGIDPHISPAYADLQVARVAGVTGLPAEQVRALVADATEGRALGFLGEPVVNVTRLNLAVAAARPGAGG
ncbi:MAG: potassium-transporting ATPase subunit C [Pseudonocardia sp.]